MADDNRYAEVERRLWSSLDLSPIDRWVELADGSPVRVQELGEGPPVLLVHGGSSSGASWAPLLPHLAGRRSLVIDRPGCGLSPPLQSGSLRRIDDLNAFADTFVDEVLAALDVTEADVVATSFGGYLGVRGAAARPGRVRRLILVAWPMGAPPASVPRSIRFAAIPGLGQLTAKIPPTRFAVRMILRQLGMGRALANGRISDEFIDWFLALLGHTDTMANEIKGIPDVVTPIRGFNPELQHDDDIVAKVTMPVLFAWGGEDPMGGAECAEPFAARFPDATVELLPLAGHAPWVDEPETVARLITESVTT